MQPCGVGGGTATSTAHRVHRRRAPASAPPSTAASCARGARRDVGIVHRCIHRAPSIRPVTAACLAYSSSCSPSPPAACLWESDSCDGALLLQLPSVAMHTSAIAYRNASVANFSIDSPTPEDLSLRPPNHKGCARACARCLRAVKTQSFRAQLRAQRQRRVKLVAFAFRCRVKDTSRSRFAFARTARTRIEPKARVLRGRPLESPLDNCVEVPIARARDRECSNELIGTSAPMRELLAAIERVAASDVTVLIEGETGSGKELVAEAIHARSPRRRAPVGRVRPRRDQSGAARCRTVRARGNAVRTANARARSRSPRSGTLFLDEIGELNAVSQPLLVARDRTQADQAAGSELYQEVDVRIIASTKHDLLADVRGGLFRDDLYHRLTVVRLRVPPLRERREDVPLLVEHFLRALCAERGSAVPQVSARALCGAVRLRLARQRARAAQRARARALARAGRDRARPRSARPARHVERAAAAADAERRVRAVQRRQGPAGRPLGAPVPERPARAMRAATSRRRRGAPGWRAATCTGCLRKHRLTRAAHSQDARARDLTARARASHPSRVPRPEKAPQTIHFVTLGCPKNRVDTEVMLGVATRPATAWSTTRRRPRSSSSTPAASSARPRRSRSTPSSRWPT